MGSGRAAAATTRPAAGSAPITRLAPAERAYGFPAALSGGTAEATKGRGADWYPGLWHGAAT